MHLMSWKSKLQDRRLAFVIEMSLSSQSFIVAKGMLNGYQELSQQRVIKSFLSGSKSFVELKAFFLVYISSQKE